MAKVTILCGTSPLPVCQALRTLKATEAVIVHGPKPSKEVAERVADFCRNHLEGFERASLVEVDPFNPYRISFSLFDHRQEFRDSDLVYGPGTSPMNALIHDFWRVQDNAERRSWYLGVQPRLLYETNHDSAIPVDDTGLAMEELIGLHLEPDSTLSPLRGLHIPRVGDENQRMILETLGEMTTRILYGVERHGDIDERFLQSLGIPVGQDLPGKLMEIVVLTFLSRISPESARVCHSVEITQKKANGKMDKVLEMDVVVAHGDRLLAVSCNAGKHPTSMPVTATSKNKSTLTTKRHKFFEVAMQAGRLGGSEGRTMTVTVDRGRKDRRGPGSVWGAEKRRLAIAEQRLTLGLEREMAVGSRGVLVDLAELLGDDPARALTSPASWLSQAPECKWILEWLDATLGGLRDSHR